MTTGSETEFEVTVNNDLKNIKDFERKKGYIALKQLDVLSEFHKKLPEVLLGIVKIRNDIKQELQEIEERTELLNGLGTSSFSEPTEVDILNLTIISRGKITDDQAEEMIKSCCEEHIGLLREDLDSINKLLENFPNIDNIQFYIDQNAKSKKNWVDLVNRLDFNNSFTQLTKDIKEFLDDYVGFEEFQEIINKAILLEDLEKELTVPEEQYVHQNEKNDNKNKVWNPLQTRNNKSVNIDTEDTNSELYYSFDSSESRTSSYDSGNFVLSNAPFELTGDKKSDLSDYEQGAIESSKEWYEIDDEDTYSNKLSESEKYIIEKLKKKEIDLTKFKDDHEEMKFIAQVIERTHLRNLNSSFEDIISHKNSNISAKEYLEVLYAGYYEGTDLCSSQDFYSKCAEYIAEYIGDNIDDEELQNLKEYCKSKAMSLSDEQGAIESPDDWFEIDEEYTDSNKLNESERHIIRGLIEKKIDLSKFEDADKKFIAQVIERTHLRNLNSSFEDIISHKNSNISAKEYLEVLYAGYYEGTDLCSSQDFYRKCAEYIGDNIDDEELKDLKDYCKREANKLSESEERIIEDLTTSKKINLSKFTDADKKFIAQLIDNADYNNLNKSFADIISHKNSNISAKEYLEVLHAGDFKGLCSSKDFYSKCAEYIRNDISNDELKTYCEAKAIVSDYKGEASNEQTDEIADDVSSVSSASVVNEVAKRNSSVTSEQIEGILAALEKSDNGTEIEDACFDEMGYGLESFDLVIKLSEILGLYMEKNPRTDIDITNCVNHCNEHLEPRPLAVS